MLRALFLNPKSGYTNGSAFYLAEYNHRAKLRKLGFTDSIENIDAVTAEIFVFISDEISGLEKEAADRRSKRSK